MLVERADWGRSSDQVVVVVVGFSRKAPELSLSLSLSRTLWRSVVSKYSSCGSLPGPQAKTVPTPGRAQWAGCGKTRRLHAPQAGRQDGHGQPQLLRSIAESLDPNPSPWIHPISDASVLASVLNYWVAIQVPGSRCGMKMQASYTAPSHGSSMGSAAGDHRHSIGFATCRPICRT